MGTARQNDDHQASAVETPSLVNNYNSFLSAAVSWKNRDGKEAPKKIYYEEQGNSTDTSASRFSVDTSKIRNMAGGSRTRGVQIQFSSESDDSSDTEAGAAYLLSASNPMIRRKEAPRKKGQARRQNFDINSMKAQVVSEEQQLIADYLTEDLDEEETGYVTDDSCTREQRRYVPPGVSSASSKSSSYISRKASSENETVKKINELPNENHEQKQFGYSLTKEPFMEERTSSDEDRMRAKDSKYHYLEELKTEVIETSGTVVQREYEDSRDSTRFISRLRPYGLHQGSFSQEVNSGSMLSDTSWNDGTKKEQAVNYQPTVSHDCSNISEDPTRRSSGNDSTDSVGSNAYLTNEEVNEGLHASQSLSSQPRLRNFVAIRRSRSRRRSQSTRPEARKAAVRISICSDYLSRSSSEESGEENLSSTGEPIVNLEDISLDSDSDHERVICIDSQSGQCPSDSKLPCTICNEEDAVHPVKALCCGQFIGCRNCVKRWYRTTNISRLDASSPLSRGQNHRNHQSCPFCRREWPSKMLVTNC